MDGIFRAIFGGFFGSLWFGFAAWGLAIAALKKSNHCSLFVGMSFACCCISAVFAFFDLRGRVIAGDWAGIWDTIDVTIGGVIIMMVITLILNLLALAWRYALSKPEPEEETA